MRFCAFIGLLFCSFKVFAAHVSLVPVLTPKPVFPSQMINNRDTGKVRVRLTVAAHGGIQATKIVESSHPTFAEATQQAVVKWRFRPWSTENGEPTKLEITVPVLFGARGIEPFSPDITIGLRNVLCAYLNYEVKSSLSNFADEPLKKVDVFWYANEFVKSAYVATQMPDSNKRQALVGQLEQAIPDIVKQCKRNPDHTVAYYLPKGIRDVLVGL
jgi:TonB family protein